MPEAPSGVVRVRVTVGVRISARDGRQGLARLLGLDPRIVLRADVAVCAAILECCKAFRTPPRVPPYSQHMWPGRAGHAPCNEVERRAAVPPAGLSVGAVALDPAVEVALTAATLSPQRAEAPERTRADMRRRRSRRACAVVSARVSMSAHWGRAVKDAMAVRAHRRTAAARSGSGRHSHECSSRRRRQH